MWWWCSGITPRKVLSMLPAVIGVVQIIEPGSFAMQSRHPTHVALSKGLKLSFGKWVGTSLGRF